MNIEAKVYVLTNNKGFRIATGTRKETKTVIVRLWNDNVQGLGEATPVPFYGISAEETVELINSVAKEIQGTAEYEPARFFSKIYPLVGHNTFALCALDIAFYDFWSKKLQLPLYEALGLSNKKLPLSDFTLGIDEIPEMVKKIKEVDFPIYKIKLGTDHDLEIIKALRKVSKAVFRVDANTGWTKEQTISNAEAFLDYDIEFIEQPMKVDCWDEMRQIVQKSNMKFFADESCRLPEDVKKCFGAFEGVNIKLAKCGGITPALQMIKQARTLGLEVMLGCMTESSIGISALGHIASLADYADLDGSLLIDNDPATGVKLDKGRIIIPNRPGTGALLK